MPEGPLLLPAEGAFFRFGCATCHLPSSAVRAPRLDGIFGRPVRLTSGETVVADANYIRESILEPQAKISAGYPTPSLMPTYQGVVTEDDLIELVEFIRSIRDGWTGEES
jgi:cytochrome c oxidase subunit 2